MRRIILAVLSLLFLLGCTETRMPEEPSQKAESQALAKGSAQENRLLSGLGRQLARAANQSQIKTWLVQQLRESGHVEEIVTLRWLFEQNIGAIRFVDAVQANTALLALVNAHALGIDVYFPVEAHRQAMRQNPGQNFLIAYWNGYDDDQAERLLTAWDRQGNEVSLTTATIPATPVLVITQCEHRGDHSVPEACGEDCGGGGGGGGSGSRDDMILEEIRIFKDYDPWPKGDMEIKMVLWKDTNINNATGYNYQAFVDLPSVNNHNQTYFPNKVIYDWTVGSTNGQVLVYVFEDDGLPPIDGNDYIATHTPYRLFTSQEYVQNNPDGGGCKIKVKTVYVP